MSYTIGLDREKAREVMRKARGLIADKESHLNMKCWGTCETPKCMAGWIAHAAFMEGHVEDRDACVLGVACEVSDKAYSLHGNIADAFYATSATKDEVLGLMDSLDSLDSLQDPALTIKDWADDIGSRLKGEDV